MVSAYFETGQLLVRQAQLLEEIAQYLGTLHQEWVLAADFQNTPPMMADSYWPQVLGGRIVSCGEPTCATAPGREIDYFVISTGLMSRVLQVPNQLVPVLRKVLCYPEEPVYGPHLPGCEVWHVHSLEGGWREWLVQVNQWLAQHHSASVDPRPCEGTATVKQVLLQKHVQRRHRQEHSDDEVLAWRWLTGISWRMLQRKILTPQYKSQQTLPLCPPMFRPQLQTIVLPSGSWNA
eukprot:4855476-Amphidinium_carterae.1